MRAALRLACLVLPLIVAAAKPAAAGDGAAMTPLGFSPDGRYFAFEQHGEQDGSGAVYATITATEVAGDRIVKGFPVMATLNSEEASRTKEPREKTIAEVRAKAAAEAAALLKSLRIGTPGRVLGGVRGSRAREVLDAEAVKTVRSAALMTLPLPRDRFGRGAQVVLKEFDIAVPRCKEQMAEGYPNGISVTVERKGRPTIHLSRDQTIPPGRGCPDRYGLTELHALDLPDGSIAFAVMVQYFYQDTEGPDRRFMAVTGRVK